MRLFVLATSTPHTAPTVTCTADGWSAWYLWCHVLHHMRSTSITCDYIDTNKVGWPAHWCEMLQHVSYARGGDVFHFGEPEE